MDRSRFKDYTSKSRQDWVDWLSDEKPSLAARQALRRERVNNASAYQPRLNQAAATVNPAAQPKPDVTININLQKIKLPKLHLPHITLDRLMPSRKITSITIFLLLIAGGAYLFLAHNPFTKSDIAISSGQTVRTEPSFKPVAPVTSSQLGKFAAHVTAYDGRHDIYSYADSIAGNRITVSEQPAPKNLGSVTQTIQQIASQTGADSKIDTKNGQAFIRTSQETGAQTVVCSVNGLLVFINSSTRFQDADWVKYISALQ